MKTIRVLNR